MKDALPDLLKKCIGAPEIPWVRLLYAYPRAVSARLKRTIMRSQSGIAVSGYSPSTCAPEMLKRMKRPSNMDWVYKTIEKLRSGNPQLPSDQHLL